MKTFYYEVLNLQTRRDFGERCDDLYYEVLHLQTLSDDDHAPEDFVLAFRVLFDDYLFSPIVIFIVLYSYESVKTKRLRHFYL